MNARVGAIRRTWTSQVAWILAGSALMAASAQIAVSAPFSPVPITGQTLGLALVAALLGGRMAGLAMVAYLIEGASGLPVFAAHHGGFVWLVSAPTTGYLWSFPIAALVTGWLFEHGLWRNVVDRFVAVLLGTLVVLACGAAWLAHIVGGIGPALLLGVYPFFVGDAVKAALAAIAAPYVARLGSGFVGR